MAPAAHTPTIRLRRFAAELRRLRREAGLTKEDVAARTSINSATLYRVENALVRPQVRTLLALLDLYAASEEERERLKELLKASGRRDGWLQGFEGTLTDRYATYIGFEEEAASIWNFEALFVPGLLQTETYARHVIAGTLTEASENEISILVEARMRRQELLKRSKPPKLWFIVDEAALRRRVGSAEEHREQLDHLRELIRSRKVTLQVIPFDAGVHPGMSGAFVVMMFAKEIGQDVVYLDSMAGDLFLEEESEVERYRLVFEHLRAAALSPTASADLIAGIASDV